MTYDAIVIGTSAGGIKALHQLLGQLPVETRQTLFIVQHIKSDSPTYFIENFNNKCQIPVLEAKDKDFALAGHVYIAPPGYHLLINEDRTMSLSLDELVNYSRPSIDVLFETAADAYADKLIGVILTGANSDGAAGLKTVKDNGGLAIVQDPEEAYSTCMPKSAIAHTAVDHVLTLDKIAEFLSQLSSSSQD